MNSQFLSLAKNDYVKGLVVAFLTAFLSAVYQSLSAHHMPSLVELQADAMAGVTAAIAYLVKNLFSNASGQLLKTDNEKVAG